MRRPPGREKKERKMGRERENKSEILGVWGGPAEGGPGGGRVGGGGSGGVGSWFSGGRSC